MVVVLLQGSGFSSPDGMNSESWLDGSGVTPVDGSRLQHPASRKATQCLGANK